MPSANLEVASGHGVKARFSITYIVHRREALHCGRSIAEKFEKGSRRKWLVKVGLSFDEKTISGR